MDEETSMKFQQWVPSSIVSPATSTQTGPLNSNDNVTQREMKMTDDSLIHTAPENILKTLGKMFSKHCPQHFFLFFSAVPVITHCCYVATEYCHALCAQSSLSTIISLLM